MVGVNFFSFAMVVWLVFVLVLEDWQVSRFHLIYFLAALGMKCVSLFALLVVFPKGCISFIVIEQRKS